MNIERFLFDRAPGTTAPGAESGADGLHDEDLFDQNESRSGDRINPVTGNEYDNSTDDGLNNLSKVTVEELLAPPTEDDLQAHIDALQGDDDARKWFEDHKHLL